MTSQIKKIYFVFRFMIYDPTKNMFKLKINNFLLKNFHLSQILSSNLSSSLSPKTSSLEGFLNSKIKLKGPITVAEYMKEALGNPKWVYFKICLKANLKTLANQFSFRRAIT